MNILEQTNIATSKNRKSCLIFSEMLRLNTQLNNYKLHNMTQLKVTKPNAWQLFICVMNLTILCNHGSLFI